MGIPADEQGKLFERFFRTSVAHRRSIEGTGLGLVIAKAIAERHGGRIGFESRVGEGTTSAWSCRSRPRFRPATSPPNCPFYSPGECAW